MEKSSKNRPGRKLAGSLLRVLIGITGIVLIFFVADRVTMVGLPDGETAATSSNGLLFVTGFLSSFHCVGMCGAMVLTFVNGLQGGKRLSPVNQLLYGVGKTISYVSMGAVLGAVGSLIAFTPDLRAVIGMTAGVFLCFYALGMLEVLPGLQRLKLHTPAFLMRFIGSQARKHPNPFIIGLLNGLMIICGPLQAMYIMAAASGDATEGARVMLFFGLGTLPVLLGFSWFASIASTGLGPRLVRYSGIVVFLLGMLMIDRGLRLNHSGYDGRSLLIKASEYSETHWGIRLAEPDDAAASGHAGMHHQMN